ncbi:recombinase RecB [Streptomyces sp. 3MP-14]|uniref:Recombinase RecB n=1 Tax=Streptomyces mimosae TaxID=2586635 RepID=A0A5N6A2M1_9ACTN|nr:MULTISPECIES: PD-(D/E)XK nuclease family protein [Streptomyces]KAB8162482.1 recombinase RecB [Streptomyces mimosae]KAB8174308.1 recombinase RecB [Streptomyces sp. 3MP-14]
MTRSAAAPPRSLSPSRAADFQQCPLLYRFRVIDRLPEEPNEAATRGTVVHAVLERVFDAPAAERSVPGARALVAPEWRRLLERRPELARLFRAGGVAAAEEDAAAAGAEDGAAGAAAADGASAGADAAGEPEPEPELDEERLAAFLAEAERLVERWFTLEDPTRLEPAERELWVETTLESGLRLRGVIDRVDVAPGGDIRIVDYKTGKAPPAEFAAGALFQMKFYALVLWRLRGVVPRRLQLVYLGSGEVLTYDPEEADLRGVERKVLALWEAIQRATESGDWRPRRGRLCGWCDHQARCPEFGGTPPPYPLHIQTALPLPAQAAGEAAPEDARATGAGAGGPE